MTTIAILSDSHDQINNLRAAISYCNEVEVEYMLHCGDLISPFMLKELTKFRGEVHIIYGNNAGDQHLITSRCQNRYDNINHHGIFGDIVIDNLRIAMVHYPIHARGLASQSTHDIICCGHSHMKSVKQYDSTTLVNPGQLLGEDDEAGFYIFENMNNTFQRIKVGRCMFDESPHIEVQELIQSSR